jgi:nitrate reductase delta subunit
MSVEENYRALALLLDYPGEKEPLIESCGRLAPFLGEAFPAMLRGSTPAELQEDYVATFDFNPALAPYLGHHLYGDNQKKASYMIAVKEQFQHFDFQPASNELPDHLGVLLSFLAHLALRGEDDFRRSFIREMVTPGLEKFVAASAPLTRSPWLSLVEAAGLLCSADCEEVSPC